MAEVKYKYVQHKKSNGMVVFVVRLPKRFNLPVMKMATNREAAIAVDKILISLGLEPVNILKPKELHVPSI